MMKIERGEKEVKHLTYNQIPIGCVFTYYGDLIKIPEDGVMYLKCRDGYSVMLTGNMGQVEEDDDFRDEPFWVVLDAKLVINA